MRSAIFLTPRKVTLDMLKMEIEKLGGYWYKSVAVDNGVIERGEAAIYIALLVGLDELALEPDQLEAYTQSIGARPESAIDIHIGHGIGSLEIARETAMTFQQLWGGILDAEIDSL